MSSDHPHKRKPRPSWDEYFLFRILPEVATRSTCLRRQVGAIVTVNNRIVATGYNGAPSGVRSCDEIGYCNKDRMGLPSGTGHEQCLASHSEQNCINSAARSGVSIEGGTMYVNVRPCVHCAKSIINSGIRRIIYQKDYPDELALRLLSEAGIQLIRIDQTEESEDQDSG